MTTEDRSTESVGGIGHVAETLIPELTQRLADHGLGELEIQHAGVRIRVRAAAGSGAEARRSTDAAAALASVSTEQAEVPPAQGSTPVVSPAVGIFVYGQGLGPGLDVSAGDPLGHVEMLGVQYEVRSPETGRVSHLVAETGEAVEYGQVLIELGPEPAA